MLDIFLCMFQNGSSSGDVGLRGNGHPGDNPFYSNIDSMPDIRPRRKSIPLVSELVSTIWFYYNIYIYKLLILTTVCELIMVHYTYTYNLNFSKKQIGKQQTKLSLNGFQKLIIKYRSLLQKACHTVCSCLIVHL